MIRLIAALFALIAAVPALAAERVLVLPFESTSVAPELANTATELMIIFLRDRGLQVTSPPEKPADAEAAARAAGATHVVEGRMTRIGTKALVFAEMRPVGAAQAVWVGRLTASRPEDLESVIARMARGIDTGESVQEAVDIHTVTETEEQRLRRRKANHYFGVSLGGFVPVQEEGIASGLGLFWLYDVRNMMFELELQGSFSDDYDRTSVGISAYYPFSEGDITPYIGGGLQYSGTSRNATNAELAAAAHDDYWCGGVHLDRCGWHATASGRAGGRPGTRLGRIHSPS